MDQQHHPKKPTKSNRKSYLNSLHSVHKPLQKPMTTKHFIAPLPPTRPKVYDVDALNFKKVVHALTSTPEFLYSSTRRLKDIAPPPLVLSTLPKQSLFPIPTPQPPTPLLESGELSNLLPDFYNYLNETSESSDTTTTFSLKSVHDDMDYLGDFGSVGFSYDPSAGGAPTSPLRFSMSPNSLSWCYSGLLSPGTLSAVL